MTLRHVDILGTGLKIALQVSNRLAVLVSSDCFISSLQKDGDLPISLVFVQEVKSARTENKQSRNNQSCLAVDRALHGESLSWFQQLSAGRHGLSCALCLNMIWVLPCSLVSRERWNAF